jgi:hypothetical protein
VTSSHSYSCSILAIAALAHPQSQQGIALHTLDLNLHPLATRLARIAAPGITRREHLTVPQRGLLVLCALILLPGLTPKIYPSNSSESGLTSGKSSSLKFSSAHGSDSHQDHQKAHQRAHQHH